MSKKLYLGDGVYFEYDGFDVTLTTENGISATNTIVLESDVISALLRALGEVWRWPGYSGRAMNRALASDAELLRALTALLDRYRRLPQDWTVSVGTVCQLLEALIASEKSP